MAYFKMNEIIKTITEGIVKSAKNALNVQYFGLNPPNTLMSFLNLLADASIFRYSACEISLPAKKKTPAIAPINGFFVKAYPML
jgi:hypothetical protein